MAKTPGTAVVDIQAELKKQADAMKGKIQSPGGDTIKTKGKEFTLPNGVKDAGPMRLVILDFVSMNAFWDRPYKDGDPFPPACIAIGNDPKNMIPDDNSPAKESEACQGCPNNEFGSKGAGKACSNSRLLAVVEPNDDPKSPIYLLKVSSTGLKSFDGYVAGLSSQFGSVPVAFTTEVYFDPALTYPSLRFGSPEPNPNLAVHFNRQKEAQARLMTLPDLSNYTPPAKPAKKGK